MKSFCTIIFLIVLAFSPFRTLRAEENFWSTAWQDFKSPVTTPAKWVLLGGTLATLTVVALRDSVDYPLQSKMSVNKPLGKWAHVGNVYGMLYPNVAYMAGMLVAANVGESESSKSRAILMLKSTIYSTAVTAAMKASFRQGRPNNSQEKNSFPSGHTSAAFSFASVIGAEHEWYWGAVAYSLATLTALSRLNDDRHFLRDVVAGATVGASYGLGLYYRQHPGSDNHVATLLPTAELDGLQFSFAARF